METFTAGLWMGRVVPIFYLAIVIPGIIYIIVDVIRAAFVSYEEKAHPYQKELDNILARLFYSIIPIKHIGVIFLKFCIIFAALFGNFIFGNLTATLTIDQNTVSYYEKQMDGFKIKKIYKTININDIDEIYQKSAKPSLNGSEYYWRIVASDSEQFQIDVNEDGKISSFEEYEISADQVIETRRLANQDKVVNLIFTKRPDLKKDLLEQN